MYLTVPFGAVLESRKSYGAVRFWKSRRTPTVPFGAIFRDLNLTVGFSGIRNRTARFGAVFRCLKSCLSMLNIAHGGYYYSFSLLLPVHYHVIVLYLVFFSPSLLRAGSSDSQSLATSYLKVLHFGLWELENEFGMIVHHNKMRKLATFFFFFRFLFFSEHFGNCNPPSFTKKTRLKQGQHPVVSSRHDAQRCEIEFSNYQKPTCKSYSRGE